MNRCAYCLVLHDRPCACCCPEHTKRMRAHRGAVTAGHTRARKRGLATIHKRELHRKRWRDVAMGRDTQLRLSEVFGVRIAA